jgi:D-lactate dehydrogenase (cytochrome)
MTRQVIHELDERYQAYLCDESRLLGAAESVSFPESEDEIVAIIAEMRRERVSVTVQGGRTGLAGSAVPLRGHVMNLSRMNRGEAPQRREDGTWVMTVQPGTTLMDLRRSIWGARVEAPLFWPPDPTETTATVGGVVSCNARGLTAMRYGGTRDHVEGFRLVSADGDAKAVVRGEGALHPDCGLDALDLAVGGEGMFGVISELTLRLIPKPPEMWGICFFFGGRQSLCAFVDRLVSVPPHAGASLAAMEYLDRRAMAIVEERKTTVTSIQSLPAVDPAALAMVYVELHGDGEEAIAELAESLMEIAVEAGGDPDRAWAVSGEAEVERLRAFRHAAAESANLLIERARRSDPSIVKLSTDMSLPGLPFSAALDLYESGLAREELDACVFGHLPENRLNVNLLPKDRDEYLRGRRLIAEWAAQVIALGGQPVNEHGVGKLKRDLVAKCSADTRWHTLRRCRTALDPEEFWNPGNMF